jgi:hypothetical protein
VPHRRGHRRQHRQASGECGANQAWQTGGRHGTHSEKK